MPDGRLGVERVVMVACRRSVMSVAVRPLRRRERVFIVAVLDGLVVCVGGEREMRYHSTAS